MRDKPTYNTAQRVRTIADHARRAAVYDGRATLCRALGASLTLTCLSMMISGLVFPALGLSVLIYAVAWARHHCDQEYQRHIALMYDAMVQNGATDAG